MTSTDIRKSAAAVLFAVTAMGLVACTSAEPTDDPGVDRMYLFRRQGTGRQQRHGQEHRYELAQTGYRHLVPCPGGQ